MNSPQQKVRFPNQTEVPKLGQGTWYMGQVSSQKSREIEAIRTGLDLGMTLIDTAEMYHDAETVVGDAIRGRRDGLFIVSKVLPSNASYQGTLDACERSLRKLDTDYIDLYLLHWPGSYPLQETFEAFEKLKSTGKIGGYGVSNFDSTEFHNCLDEAPAGAIGTNQVLYNLEVRGIEWSLLPHMRKQQIPAMAYSPLNQGRMNFEKLQPLAEKYEATTAQIALAWLLHQDGVISIPKSSDISHVTENFGAMDIRLSGEDLLALDRLFPPPSAETPLSIL